MKEIYRRCAGLDVHEKNVFVCARIMRGKQAEIIEATFSTFTDDLEALRDWLIRNRIPRVAMESTGVYWRPVWNILEQPPGKPDLVLLNPQHVKALQGHKTDRVDAARIAELLQCDLVRRRVHLLATPQELEHPGVGFVSLTEALDLTTPAERAMAGLLAIFAEFEREILRERTRAGLAHARQNGQRLGRPQTAALKAAEVQQLYRKGVGKAEIARRLEMGRTPVRRILAPKDR
jgi:hypothetical protein